MTEYSNLDINRREKSLTLEPQPNFAIPLRISHLTKRYRIDKNREIVAIHDVSLAVKVKETVAVVGESGSGKSTLLYSIMRLVNIDEGSIEYCGTEVTTMKQTKLRSLRKHVQFIPQDPFASLNPRRRIGNSIGFGLRLQGDRDLKLLEEKVGNLLVQVGLHAEDMYKYPHEFSGGQRQRICIARAIATLPEVIVADEPTAALDLTVRESILELFHDIQGRYGVGILIATHDFSIVEKMANVIVVMYLGEVVEFGSTTAVLANPQHEYTRRLLAAIPTGDPKKKKQLTVHTETLQSVMSNRDKIHVPVVYCCIDAEAPHFVAQQGNK